MDFQTVFRIDNGQLLKERAADTEHNVPVSQSPSLSPAIVGRPLTNLTNTRGISR